MLCYKCNKRDRVSGNSICKVCSYKKRNHDKISEELSKSNWTEEMLDIVLDYVLYKKCEVVNEIVDVLSCDKSLKDVVDLITNLHIGGRTVLQIKLYCFSCGEELIRPIGHFYKDRVYCSLKCRDQYKTDYLSGENSPWYKRVNTTCSNCGKEMKIIPFEYNLLNEYGESNNFCSRTCYCEYRSKYYIGEKHPMFGRPVSEENKQKMRERSVRLISEGKIPQTMTKPHKIIYNLLVENKILCENEHPLKYHSIDIYLQDYNLMIEIMGDYWHGIPLKYQYSDLNKQQLKSIKQDKSKHTYTKKYHSVEILYLWERDIKHRIELCWNLIQMYINNQGVLDDYNSYNYDFIDNVLILKEDITQPYFITQNPDRLQEVDGNANLEVVYPTSIMEGYNIQSALTQ
jgi:hypothetical protein